MMKKIIQIIAIFLILPYSLSIAQHDLKVQNVRFQTLGDTVVIHYDLKGNPKKKYEINLLLSHDYGKTFTIHPKSVKGDIGRGVKTGSAKEIIWNKKKDFPYGLIGNGYVFAVDAAIQKPPNYFPYILVGSVIGTFVYLSHRQSKSTGFEIIMPAEY